MWFVKVGTRVTGPFNEDELRTKRQCKELAPFHLVSRDGIRWETAAPLIKWLDGDQPDWKLHQPPEPYYSPRDEFSGATPTKSTTQWYYVDSSRQQHGPIPQDVLCDLLKTRQINGRSLAFKVGETQWNQIRNHPELAPSIPTGPSQTTIIACSATLGAALLAGLVGWLASSKPRDEALARIDNNPTTRVDRSGSRPPVTPTPTPPEARRPTPPVAYDPPPPAQDTSPLTMGPSDEQMKSAIGKLIAAWLLYNAAVSGNSDQDGFGQTIGRGIAFAAYQGALTSAVDDLFGSRTAAEKASAKRIIGLLLEGRLTPDNLTRATREDALKDAIKREAPDLANAVDVLDFLNKLQVAVDQQR